MKKKFLLICVLFCMILTTISCSENSNKKNENGVERINMLKTNLPYSIRETMSIAIKKNIIEKQYGKANLTGTSETKNYEIRNRYDKSKLIVIYDNATKNVTDIWQLTKLLTREDFKVIEEGKSLVKDVFDIDTYTNIFEKDMNNAISEHKLVNNEALVIDYVKKNDSWVVNKLTYINPDPSNLINIIKEKDLISLGLLPSPSSQNKNQ